MRLAIISGVFLMVATTAFAAEDDFKIERARLATWASFSDAVIVSGKAKTIYLSGVGSEDENGPRGNIRHLGDPYRQCLYAMDKIKRVLAAQGATLADIVKTTTYATTMHARDGLRQCRAETMKDVPNPAATFVSVNDLALPGMMIEIEVIAAIKDGSP